MPDEAAATIAPDAPDQSAVSTMVSPDAAPLSEAKQRALEKHFTPAQLDALKNSRPATEEAPAETPAKSKAKAKAAATPAPAPAPEAKVVTPEPDADEVVVEFSDTDEPEPPASDTPAGEEPETPALSDDELQGLDEKARKKLTDAHKEAAKVRKRAQEAERKAQELTARLEELEASATQRGNDIPAELNATNSLARITDDKMLAAYEKDARNVLAILQGIANGQELDTNYRSLVDGTVYELDHTYAAWAAGTILDVEGRRKQLAVLRKAQDAAGRIESHLKDTPGFKDALKGISGDNLVTEWPQRRVQAAIGQLVTSGQYRLIKISKGNAAGATSPASVTAPVPKKAQTSSSTPQRELRGTMPSGSPAGEEGVSSSRLSQLQQQAMKTGHPDDVKALMAAKMALRRSNR